MCSAATFRRSDNGEVVSGSESSGRWSPEPLSPPSASRHDPQPVGRRIDSTELKRNARYKTTLCRHFERSGRCDAGDRCAFAHGVSELRVSEVHPKYKTRFCADFWRDGHCVKGSACHFIHDERFGQMLAIRERQLAANADLREAVCLCRITRRAVGFDVYGNGARCTPFTGLGTLELLYQPSVDPLADAPLFDMWEYPFGKLFWIIIQSVNTFTMKIFLILNILYSSQQGVNPPQEKHRGRAYC